MKCDKHVVHITKISPYINIFYTCVILILFLFVISSCDQEPHTISESSILMTDNQDGIPSVTFDEFNELIKEDNLNNIDKIKDLGGKVSVFAITQLGSDYKDALERFYKEAPHCIGVRNAYNANTPVEVKLPDGSYRRTFATEFKQFPKCLHMTILSGAFDIIDEKIANLLQKLNGNQELGYILGEKSGANVTSLGNAPIKDHIHVYTTGKEQATFTNSNTETEYLVPYHVDNGIYLLLTPFPNHGLEVELSTGKKISTKNIDSNSILILMGRGLTDWLLQLTDKIPYYATPHAVPPLTQSGISSRSVYARMKVAPESAKPALRSNLVDTRQLKTFQEVFMETKQQSDDDELCFVGLKGKRDLNHSPSNTWSHAQDTLCEAGQAYCWMSCRPLPAKCPSVEQAKCYSSVTNISCG